MTDAEIEKQLTEFMTRMNELLAEGDKAFLAAREGSESDREAAWKRYLEINEEMRQHNLKFLAAHGRVLGEPPVAEQSGD